MALLPASSNYAKAMVAPQVDACQARNIHDSLAAFYKTLSLCSGFFSTKTIQGVGSELSRDNWNKESGMIASDRPFGVLTHFLSTRCVCLCV
jgi:hypothetical protein